VDRDVMALFVFETLDDLVAFDRPDAGYDELLPDALAGGLMDLMEADLVALSGGVVEADRYCHQRQLQKAGPIRSCGSWHVTMLQCSLYPTIAPPPLFRYREPLVAAGVCNKWSCRSI